MGMLLRMTILLAAILEKKLFYYLLINTLLNRYSCVTNNLFCRIQFLTPLKFL
jgi:hypothetical protein